MIFTYNMNLLSTKDTMEALMFNIVNKIPNVYLRFGDGDFNLMSNMNDMLAVASKDISDSYVTLFSKLLPENMVSINFHCQGMNTIEPGMYPGVHEYPTDMVNNFISKLQILIPGIKTIYSHVAIHHTLSYNPALFGLFLQIIKHNGSTIILGDKDFKGLNDTKLYFGDHTYISGNSNNSFNEKDRICDEFDDVVSKITCDFTVCILTLGCGGRAMAHRFIDSIKKYEKKMLIIDFGSAIDILLGKKDTRAWISMTNPNVEEVKRIMSQQ